MCAAEKINCKVCKLPNAETHCPTYWAQDRRVKYYYHKECFQKEAHEMQRIDANCNDCFEHRR